MSGTKLGLRLLGTGSFLPPVVVKNEEFAQHLDTSDEWIVSRTGIHERRFAFGQTVQEIGTVAAKNALEDAGVSPDEIDMVVVSSATQTYLYPAAACMIAANLGIENAVCFDVAAACTGFLTALDLAHSHLSAHKGKKALVIGSEMLSLHTDFSDRATCVLFGDGAGAVVVECGEGMYSSYIGSKPENEENSLSFKISHAPNHRFCGHTPEVMPHGYLEMDGKAVYKFAVEAMPFAVNKAAEKAGIDIADLDLIIPHQANMRIIKTAAKALGVPMDKVFTNIERRGNPSSACIPTALDELKREGKLEKGTKLCMVAFGAGLTFGAICLEI